ncbi:MAG TPA: outer membrane beta-barrel family protein [Chitinophagaceae bacterium]|nr:outer membrane beta-barrel family protein [Chitinophagaceae bacterium]
MKYIFTLSFVLITSLLLAQPPMGGGNRGAGQQISGRLYGKIVETSSGKPVEFASVQLLQNKLDTITRQRKETVIGGMLTRANGDFSIENVPVFGPLKLKITGIGFKEYTQNVSFELKRGGDPSAMMNALDKDLGNIKIEIEEKILGNVTVTSEKPGLQLGIDRKIFNVDKNLVSAGGTAVDIMRNIPSLNVDIDGNVTMRNNAPQLFVDGRPTTLTLEQIPSDAIQSVELITNPSAKFDASGGTSGILNIVLKKEKKVGYNGNLRTNIDSRARVGVGGDINLRQQKLNLFAGGMFNQRKSISNGTTTRTNLFDTPDTYISQTDRSVQLGQFGFGRAGFDYFISNRNTLSLSVNFARGTFKPHSTSDIFIDTLYTPDKSSSFYDRTSDMKGNFRNLGSTLSFKHNFPKAGREWTADVTYNKSKNTNNSNIVTDTFNVPQHQLLGTYRQLQQANGANENVIIQTDFVNPINEKSRLEAGVRAQLRRTSNASAFYVDENGQWILQPASQTNYESNDEVYAAYGAYSSQLGSFGYQLGLRAESSVYEGKLTKTGEMFDIKFPVSLFPSIFVSQKLSEDQSLQLNYSRRINRPNFWQLTPITDSSDKLNPSKGNPALKPEFTNSFELSYEKTFKNKGNFLASLYYKHTTDLITRFQERGTGSGGETVALSTFINANSSYVTGLELTSRNNLTKWWEFTPNFNLYTSDVKINLPGEPDQPRLTSYFVKINNTFKLPKNFTIQLSGEYQSKTVLPPGGSGGGGGGRGFGGGGGMFGGPASASQGYVRPNYGVDMAVRYEFLKNRAASVSINMNDIFRTRRSDIHSESSFIIQDAFRRRDPQILRINFNWRFGKIDPNLFKRKNTRAEQGAGDNMNMGQ